jgi:hypothetical protein
LEVAGAVAEAMPVAVQQVAEVVLPLLELPVQDPLVVKQ